jgi:hypothetical protein
VIILPQIIYYKQNLSIWLSKRFYLILNLFFLSSKSFVNVFILIMLITFLVFTQDVTVTKFFDEHFYFLYSCAALCRDTGGRARASPAGDSAPGGDAVPPGGAIRSAAVHLHSSHLPAAALLHGGAGPKAAGDGPLRGQAGQLRLSPRRGTKGEFT